jgi:hypothetical protein
VGVLDGQDGGGRRVGSAGAVGAWGVPGPGDGEDVPGSLLEGDILWIGEAVLIPKLSLRRFVPDGCEDIQCPMYSIVSLAIRRITITARSAPIRRYDAPTVSVALTAEWRQLYYQRWAAVRLASQTEAADSPPNAARLRKLRHFKPRDLVRSDGTQTGLPNGRPRTVGNGRRSGELSGDISLNSLAAWAKERSDRCCRSLQKIKRRQLPTPRIEAGTAG